MWGLPELYIKAVAGRGLGFGPIWPTLARSPGASASCAIAPRDETFSACSFWRADVMCVDGFHSGVPLVKTKASFQPVLNVIFIWYTYGILPYHWLVAFQHPTRILSPSFPCWEKFHIVFAGKQQLFACKEVEQPFFPSHVSLASKLNAPVQFESFVLYCVVYEVLI